MKVISKKDTKRLVKGIAYDVYKLNMVDKKSNRWFRPSITIKLNNKVVHEFKPDYFTLEDGKPIPNINWNSDESRLDQNKMTGALIDANIKSGDFVIAKRNNAKSLVLDKIYKVTDVKVKSHTYSRGYSWNEIKIQIEGSNRFYSSYSFRKCSPEEAREIQLNTIFEEETGVKKVEKNKRKIDQYEGKDREQILIHIILLAMVDINRNNMSIIDWACKKSGKIYSVEPSDFTEIINKNLITIIQDWG